MAFSQTLTPRHGSVLRVLIVARISGCQNQKELSLEDQVDHAKQEVAERYSGPVEFIVISTIGKGERLDRPELAEVEEIIRRGGIDLLIMEDVGRMVRGTAAKDLWGLAVDNGIRCIAPNDGLDTANESWEEDLIAACKDHVSHCAHTSRRIKHKTMNRFKRNGGSIPLQTYGYIKPPGAKHFSELIKDDAATPILREGLEILRRTRCWISVADYFNQNSVPVGPYCRRKSWNGAMVNRLYHNSILKGTPQRGKRHTKKQHSTGIRISVINPEGPTYRDEPHLAHFEAAEIDQLLAEVDAIHKKLGRKPGPQSDRATGSAKRSRFPGRGAKCFYCGRDLVWGGNGIRDNLMCRGSREHLCWNSIGINGPMAAEKILEVIRLELSRLDGVEEQFSDLIHQALAGSEGLSSMQADLERSELEHSLEKEKLKATIRQLGPHDLLNEMLREHEERGRGLSRQRHLLESRSREIPKLPPSPKELFAQFEEASKKLMIDSFEFSDLLRSLVPELHIYLVQPIDCYRLLPRARVKIALGGIIRDINRAPALGDYLTRVVTIDLFQPPMHHRIRDEAVRQTAEGIGQRDIAATLKTHQATVQRALKLDRLMRERGLASPYELVTAPPTSNVSKRLIRSQHDRYVFTVQDGYIPPILESGEKT